ncbi:MAG: hypothetical protein RR341_08295, partial [Bacteroidales bacterium]
MPQKLIRIRQNTPSHRIEDVYKTVRMQIDSVSVDWGSLQNRRIGITVGSRGIKNITDIVRSITDAVKDHGAIPIVIAAMGSHGGATAAGQREMLKSLGVTEDSVGADIICHDGPIQKRETLGITVFCNTEATNLGALII